MSPLEEIGADGQARLVSWLADTYTDDGITLWWAHYRESDEEQKRSMIRAAAFSSAAGDGVLVRCLQEAHVSKSKDIGTAFTTGVIRYLKANGMPHAELRNQAGEHDKGDIVGVIGVCIECKGGKAAENASDLDVERWLAETERERVNSESDIGLLVMKRKGIGRERAGQWWVVMPMWTVDRLCGSYYIDYARTAPTRMHLADVVTMLRIEGYGDPVVDAA